MSFLMLSGVSQTWQMRVTSFSAPVYGTISSAQTKNMAMHFPIKMTQPDIQFSVQFISENEYETFQRFVRSHQQAVTLSPADVNLVTLYWPERSIYNWTGVIKRFKAGGARRNFAPKADFVVDLVQSATGPRTDIASVAPNWQTIFGYGVPGMVQEAPFTLPFFGAANPSGIPAPGITAGG